jgi:hypothetical protein
VPSHAQAYQRSPLDALPAERTSRRRLSARSRPAASAHVMVVSAASARWKFDRTRSTYPCRGPRGSPETRCSCRTPHPRRRSRTACRRRTHPCTGRWLAAPWSGTPGSSSRPITSDITGVIDVLLRDPLPGPGQRGAGPSCTYDRYTTVIPFATLPARPGDPAHPDRNAPLTAATRTYDRY